jgi:tRNA (guanine-N7-)-methyltransferase
MNPKSLKCPFNWENRKPLICDQVLYVPEYYDRHHEFTFPGWEDPSLFGKPGKIVIEYCAGNGAWILDKAINHPDVHWVAVDQRFDRVRKIWAKIQNYNLKNLVVVSGEALTFTRFYVPDNSIFASYVNFPDPWPKDKHAKNRLIQGPFLNELSRVQVKGGETTFVTDDENYMQQMIQEMSQCQPWSSRFPNPYYVTDWPNYGNSYFEQLWREKGRVIHYMQFINRKGY